MLTVHHLNNSRSQRVLWLLEELGVPYQIERYQRDPKTMLAPPELRAVHPLGKSPVITDGAFTLAESGAIVEYLIDQHGHGALVPAPGTPERLRYRYWMHYAEGSLATPLLLPTNEFEPLLALALQQPSEVLREGGRFGNFASDDFRRALTNNAQVTELVDGQVQEFIKKIEQIPWKKVNCSANVRFEPLIEKIVAHVRGSISVVIHGDE
eukprot:gene27311-48869_t